MKMLTLKKLLFLSFIINLNTYYQAQVYRIKLSEIKEYSVFDTVGVLNAIQNLQKFDTIKNVDCEYVIDLNNKKNQYLQSGVLETESDLSYEKIGSSYLVKFLYDGYDLGVVFNPEQKSQSFDWFSKTGDYYTIDKGSKFEIIEKKERSNQNEANGTISQTITIGKQVWMTKNLDVSTFRNGDPIPQAKTAEEWKKAELEGIPAWCYYDNKKKNGKKYGKLYNWYAVNDPRGLAPVGYHVPTDTDWWQLNEYLEGEFEAGKKLKSTDGWQMNEGKMGNGTNESGFNGLPSGTRYNTGTFDKIGVNGYFWSASELTKLQASLFELDNIGDSFIQSGYPKGGGFSVRCLRD